MKFNFKKVISVLLVLAMILSLTACAKTQAPQETEAPTEEAPTAPENNKITATYTTVTEGMDWGPAVTKVILHPETAIDAASVTADKFVVSSARTYPDFDYINWCPLQTYAHVEEREIVDVYVSDENGNKGEGEYITIEMAVAPYLEAGSPFWFNLLTNQNEPIEITHAVSTVALLTTVDGKEVELASTTAANHTGDIRPIADEFDLTGTYTYNYDGGNRKIDLTYASWFPKEGAAESSTPLIIWLHGMGEGGTDPFVAIEGNKVINLATEEVQKNFGETGAAVLAPQSPTMWMDISGSFNMGMGSANSESFYTEALMSLIVDFVKEHPEIDPTRLYIGGCSNGGYMTINLLATYPRAFAAAYPVCEPYANDWLTEEKLANVAKTPIWLTAAKSDTIVTLYEGYWDEEPPYLYHVTTNENGEETPIYEYSNALFDRLKKAGAEVHYTLFDKVLDTTGNYVGMDGTPYEYDGHWSWIYTLNNQCVEEIDGKEVSLFAWMAEQKGEGVLPTLPLDKVVYEKPINFYLVRHGETEYNVQEIAQGWCDSPLTQNGIDLSLKLGEGLKDVDFVAAYTSDSGRAVDTCNNVLKDREVPITVTENLREMYFGEMEGKPNSEMWSEELMGYLFGVGFDIYGGETWEELGNRIHATLEDAALEYREEGGNILISTHGMSVLAALYALVPDAEGVMEQEGIDNCAVTILEWDNGVYTLKTLNDTSYIE